MEKQILKRLNDLEQRYEDVILELTKINDCLKAQADVNKNAFEVIKLFIEAQGIKSHSPFNKGERL
jgi:hypothetical protein